jgi:CRISPR/Cas system-associated protein Cas7 (RAMP superfamily)
MACREFKPSEYRKKSASFRLLAFISPFIVFSLAVFVTMYPFVARSYWTPQKQIIISREMILESQDDLSEYTDTVEEYGKKLFYNEDDVANKDFVSAIQRS